MTLNRRERVRFRRGAAPELNEIPPPGFWVVDAIELPPPNRHRDASAHLSAPFRARSPVSTG